MVWFTASGAGTEGLPRLKLYTFSSPISWARRLAIPAISKIMSFSDSIST